MNSKTPALIAIAFFAIWIAILYAGSDHPPPVGFLWLVPLVVACAVAVYLRVPVYASWSSSHRPGRIRRVLLEGIAAGIIVGLIALLFPFTGEPTIAPKRLADILTWLAVLAAVGTANAAVVYALASVWPKGGH
jgi:membrane protease YdiL (CAAX protease family)